MLFKYAAHLAYDGTDYCGWQKQKGSAAAGKPSLQLTVEKSVSKLTSEEVSIVASGRTDSGVHASGQVVHFVVSKKAWDTNILKNGLNSLLPKNIRIIEVRNVPLDFHAQRTACRKQYSYYFQQGPCPLPHIDHFSWWIRKKLDASAMEEALQSLIGEHDFKPFQAAGAKPGKTIRTILEADIKAEPVCFPACISDNFHFIRMRLVGNGFLKQMVRGIAGTLLQVGEGRRSSDCIERIIKNGKRSDVGPTAPARGLWLERVWYPKQFGLEWDEK
ncbi:MAG: tRNA pseudouridine(38-40) synthase TruA [Bdellovibrionota bacterium]